MKMAKASNHDIDITLRMIAYLEHIANWGQFPTKNQDDDDELEQPFDECKKEHLQRFYEAMIGFYHDSCGGLFRVGYGFATLAHNQIFDPALDHLELNPALWENDDPEKPTDIDWLANKVMAGLQPNTELNIYFKNGYAEVNVKNEKGDAFAYPADKDAIAPTIFKVLKIING